MRARSSCLAVGQCAPPERPFVRTSCSGQPPQSRDARRNFQARDNSYARCAPFNVRRDSVRSNPTITQWREKLLTRKLCLHQHKILSTATGPVSFRLSECQGKSYNWRTNLNNIGSKTMKPFRVKLALTACLLALCSSGLISFPPASHARASNQKPRYNVLFIISDDLRPELGSYGNPIIRTPNIDGLAARGTRFDRAYAQYPLCNPSRASLLNGRYPTQTGVMDNNTYFRVKHPDYVTLPQHFKSNGYATLRTGKIFHGGIDDEVSWTEGGEPPDPAITGRGASAQSRANARRPGAIAERDPDEADGATTAQPQTPTGTGGGDGAGPDRILRLVR